MEKINIFWFRRDLRLSDNCGLCHALNSGLPVLPIFIFDKLILDDLDDKSDSRVDFILNTLVKLRKELRKSKSDIRIFFDSPIEVFKQLIKEYAVDEVFTNEDYEPYAIKRDKEVQELLNKIGVEFKTYKDQVIFAKDDIVKDDGTPYTVYTPYMKKWRAELKESDFNVFSSQLMLSSLLKFHSDDKLTWEFIGFKKSNIEFPDYEIGDDLLRDYAEQRDLPAKDATSKIGIHLRFGTIGIRELMTLVWKKSPVYANELIWREFFMQILYHFPYVVSRSFKKKYEAIEWNNDEAEFQKWCEGKTGFPMVDAGMRELNKTGFMHNRVRMIVASFLVKDLLIDWRWGEAYFASKLLDYELASNNGNWQWAAGTGCDAAPYFRVFNPDSQLKKFDPKGEYVRKWIDEFDTLEYSKPMIDHDFARKRAIETYKKALS